MYTQENKASELRALEAMPEHEMLSRLLIDFDAYFSWVIQDTKYENMIPCDEVSLECAQPSTLAMVAESGMYVGSVISALLKADPDCVIEPMTARIQLNHELDVALKPHFIKPIATIIKGYVQRQETEGQAWLRAAKICDSQVSKISLMPPRFSMIQVIQDSVALSRIIAGKPDVRMIKPQLMAYLVWFVFPDCSPLKHYFDSVSASEAGVMLEGVLRHIRSDTRKDEVCDIMFRHMQSRMITAGLMPVGVKKRWLAWCGL